jgi:hypothetical protein
MFDPNNFPSVVLLVNTPQSLICASRANICLFVSQMMCLVYMQEPLIAHTTKPLESISPFSTAAARLPTAIEERRDNVVFLLQILRKERKEGKLHAKPCKNPSELHERIEVTGGLVISQNVTQRDSIIVEHYQGWFCLALMDPAAAMTGNLQKGRP